MAADLTFSLILFLSMSAELFQYPASDAVDCGERQDFLGVVYEEYVSPPVFWKDVLLEPVAFPDSPF